MKRGKPCLRKAVVSPYNRRVFVVTYHYRMAFGGLSKLHSHVRYVERPEAQANVNGEKSNGDRLFDANGAVENGHAVVQTWKDDRHHFRIIISPNDGHELDMHKLVRDVMRDIEKGVGIIRLNTHADQRLTMLGVVSPQPSRGPSQVRASAVGAR